jgi:hypothetical protein
LSSSSSSGRNGGAGGAYEVGDEGVGGGGGVSASTDVPLIRSDNKRRAGAGIDGVVGRGKGEEEGLLLGDVVGATGEQQQQKRKVVSRFFSK